MYNKCIVHVHVLTYIYTCCIIQLTFCLNCLENLFSQWIIQLITLRQGVVSLNNGIAPLIKGVVKQFKWFFLSISPDSQQTICSINLLVFSTPPGHVGSYFVKHKHNYLKWGQNDRWTKKGDGWVTVWSTYQILYILWTNPF